MIPDSFFGVPSHPLLVHFPVVLIPVVALLVFAMIAKPGWRESLAVPVATLAVVVAAATLAAAQAGEDLQGRVPDAELVRRHAELGDQLKVIVLLMTGLVVAYAVGLRMRDRKIAPKLTRALPAVLIASVVVGALATVWDVRTGHAGAEAVWHGTPASRLNSGPG